MNSEWFEKVINEQIKTCTDVLIGKAKEYATDDDRLHNFKNAAGMMGCDPKEALAGMMAKHTISIYDMCRNGKDYPIKDHIKLCTTWECHKCPYEPIRNCGKDCDTLFIQDFEKLIADVIEYAHNEPTFRGTNDEKC